MSVYAAIDLHSNNSVLAVLDESDRVLRQRRLPNELPAILRELEPFHDELAGVVVESVQQENPGQSALFGISERYRGAPRAGDRRFLMHKSAL